MNRLGFLLTLLATLTLSAVSLADVPVHKAQEKGKRVLLQQDKEFQTAPLGQQLSDRPFIDRDGDGIQDGQEHRFRRDKKKRAKNKKKKRRLRNKKKKRNRGLRRR